MISYDLPGGKQQFSKIKTIKPTSYHSESNPTMRTIPRAILADFFSMVIRFPDYVNSFMHTAQLFDYQVSTYVKQMIGDDSNSKSKKGV